jgi:O-antigen/teichoic acid export membrane protein
MQRNFVTNLMILLLLNLLIKPFWILVIEPHVQNQVGNDAYGQYFALFNFSFLLNILLDVGITNFNNKNIAQNSQLLTKHFSALFVLKLGLAVLYIIATLAVGLIIDYDVRLLKLLLMLGFNQFLISMVLYLRSNLQGLHLFKIDALISVLDRVLMIGIMAALLWTDTLDRRLDIMDFVYTQTIGYLITAGVAFLYVARKMLHVSLKWSFPFSIMILKKSFPFAILVLLMTFYNRIDSVMLERMLPAGDPQKVTALRELRDPAKLLRIDQQQQLSDLTSQLEHTGPEQAGIYAKAYRLLDATNMIAYLFAILLLPMFSRMLKYDESIEQLAKLAFTLLITPAIVIAVGCAFYADELMHLLYGSEHLGDVTFVFSVLMCCFVAISTTYVFGTLLTANGNMRELNIMALCGMLFNIGMNYLFIHELKMEARGTAISSLATQLLTAIAQVIIVQRMFRFRINYRLLSNLVVYAAGVIAIAQICHSYLLYPGKTGWVIGFIIMVAVSLAWAFATRLISVKGLFRILKYG